MGYRSDVAYVIKFKTIEERDAYVTYMSAKNDEHIKQALTEVDRDGIKSFARTSDVGVNLAEVFVILLV